MKIKSAVLVGAILTLGFFPAPVLAMESNAEDGGQVVLAKNAPKQKNNKKSGKSNKKSNKGSNKGSGKDKTGESTKQSGSTKASTSSSSSSSRSSDSSSSSSSSSGTSSGTLEKGECPAGSVHANEAYGPNEKLQTVSSCYIKDNKNDLMPTASRLINVVVGVIGFVAVIMIILGAVQFLTSTGDASKVKKAKDTILYGVIGLVVAILAFSIVNFVLSSVSKGGTGTDSSSSRDEDEDSDSDDNSDSESDDDSDDDSDDNAPEEDTEPDDEQ